MAGTVYLVTNKINGKQYVGQTVVAGNSVGHGLLVSAAYKKYGKDAFSYEVICGGFEKKLSLDFAERFWIGVFDCQEPNGYNISSGGNGKGKTAESTKQKLRLANIGKKHSEKTIALMKEARKNVSVESRMKMSEARKGRVFSEETRKKIADGNTGKVVSAETRMKIAKFNIGKVVSEETRIKLSEAAKRQWSKKKGAA